MEAVKKKRILTPAQKARVRERYIIQKGSRMGKAKERYAAKREEILAKTKEYQARNKEAIAEKRRAAYLANHEARKAREREKWASLSAEEKARRSTLKRKWEADNRESLRPKKQAWREANVEKARQSQKDHYKRNPHKQRERYLKHYNPARIRERYKTDPQFRMKCTLRVRLRRAIKAQKGKRSADTMKLTGCTLPFLVKHLESLFQPGMTWENHGWGHGKWNVDHKRPCASFDLTDPAQQLACFSYTNLQPLWHVDNAAKGDKLAA